MAKKNSPKAATATEVAAEFKIGGKVRVLDDNGKPMKKVFTILPVEKGEAVPGPDWFAVTDHLFVHRSDLIAA